MTAWLTGLLASVIRPILREELDSLKSWAFQQSIQLQQFQRFDREAQDLIERMANATTSEEKWAHLRDLRARRAKLNLPN